MASDIKTNFCFPVRELSNDRVKLVPFSASVHGPTYFKLAEPEQKAIYAHMSVGPWANCHDFVTQCVDQRSNPDPGLFPYAIIDKTKPPQDHDGHVCDEEGALAGTVSLMDSSVANLSTEIGFVVTLPAFQRTHVTSNAIGLLLQYALEPKTNGGLGLRRVSWQTNSENKASWRTAEKFGFKFEGITRWAKVFHDAENRGKIGNGRGVPPGGNEGDVGRDTVNFGLCWDDWESGGREHMQALMDRR